MAYWIARRQSGAMRTFSSTPTSSSSLKAADNAGELDPWDYAASFSYPDDAVECVHLIRQHSAIRLLSVVDDNGKVVWSERDGWATQPPGSYPQEETVEQQLQQTLNVPREALIEALQANLDEEKAKRQAAEDARAENRSKIAAAIHTLTDDELINIINNVHYAVNALDFTQWVEKIKEEKTYASPEATPSDRESKLEKTVRVLNMANDTTIEVSPMDPIYPLL